MRFNPINKYRKIPKGNNEEKKPVHQKREVVLVDGQEIEVTESVTIVQDGIPVSTNTTEKHCTASGKIPEKTEDIVARCCFEHVNSPFLTEKELTICPVCERIVCRWHSKPIAIGRGSRLYICIACFPRAKRIVFWRRMLSALVNSIIMIVDIFSLGSLRRIGCWYTPDLRVLLKKAGSRD